MQSYLGQLLGFSGVLIPRNAKLLRHPRRSFPSDGRCQGLSGFAAFGVWGAGRLLRRTSHWDGMCCRARCKRDSTLYSYRTAFRFFASSLDPLRYTCAGTHSLPLLDRLDHPNAHCRFGNSGHHPARHDRHLASSHLPADGEHPDPDLVSGRDVGQDSQCSQRRQPRSILDRIRRSSRIPATGRRRRRVPVSVCAFARQQAVQDRHALGFECDRRPDQHPGHVRG